MTRKTDQLPKGFSWCTKSSHLVPIERFYRRKSGRLSSWCIDCNNAHARESKDLKTKTSKILDEIAELNERFGKVESQKVVRSHLSMGSSAPEPEDVEFPLQYLDWLTPLYGKQDRSKLEQQGNDED